MRLCVRDNAKRALYRDGDNSTLYNYETITRSLAPRAVLSHGHTGQLPGGPAILGAPDSIWKIKMKVHIIKYTQNIYVHNGDQLYRGAFIFQVEKNHLRSTMGQQQLNLLSLMCIESDILKNIDFQPII